jgi:hypothetical protein
MDEVARIEQAHPQGSHSSSFLPIQEFDEAGLGASFHSRLDGIQEDEERQYEAPVISTQAVLQDSFQNTTHSTQFLYGSSDVTEAADQVPLEQRDNASRVQRDGLQNADTSNHSPHIKNGPSSNLDHSTHISRTRQEERRPVEYTHQSDQEGPQYALPNSRTMSNLGLQPRLGTDMSELEEVQNLGKATGYLPCHYFDYIAGTSTGGLV